MYLLPLLLISFSLSGGGSCERGFSPLFSSLQWVPVYQNVFLIPLVGLDIPCKTGKDGGFIRETVPSVF